MVGAALSCPALRYPDQPLPSPLQWHTRSVLRRAAAAPMTCCTSADLVPPAVVTAPQTSPAWQPTTGSSGGNNCSQGSLRYEHQVEISGDSIRHGFKTKLGKVQPRMGPGGSSLCLFFMSLICLYVYDGLSDMTIYWLSVQTEPSLL